MNDNTRTNHLKLIDKPFNLIIRVFHNAIFGILICSIVCIPFCIISPTSWCGEIIHKGIIVLQIRVTGKSKEGVSEWVFPLCENAKSVCRKKDKKISLFRRRNWVTSRCSVITFGKPPEIIVHSFVFLRIFPGRKRALVFQCAPFHELLENMEYSCVRRNFLLFS